MTWHELLKHIKENLGLDFDNSTDKGTKHSILMARDVIDEFYNYNPRSKKSVNNMVELKLDDIGPTLKGFSFYVWARQTYLYDYSYLSSQIESYVSLLNSARVYLCTLAAYISKYEPWIISILDNQNRIIFDGLFDVFLDKNSNLSCKICYRNIRAICKLQSSEMHLSVINKNGDWSSYSVNLAINPFNKIEGI